MIKPSGDIQHITEVICKALNPEYILLFGTLAGGISLSAIKKSNNLSYNNLTSYLSQKKTKEGCKIATF